MWARDQSVIFVARSTGLPLGDGEGEKERQKEGGREEKRKEEVQKSLHKGEKGTKKIETG